MEETVLSWTVPNWITVCLMALLGFAVIGFLAKGAKKISDGRAANAAA